MRFSLCVNQPGYFPDSDSYPYEIVPNGPDDLAETILREYEISVTEMSPNIDDDVKTDVTECANDLWNGITTIFQDSLPCGELYITVERV